MSTPTGTPSRKPAAQTVKDTITTRGDQRKRDDQKESAAKTKDAHGFLKTPAGKVVLSILCLVALGFAVYQLKAFFHGDTPGDPNTSMFVDAQTGQAFPHTNVVGESLPVYSPYSHANTGYPAVPCYWTASGQVKDEPTWVLMNKWIGKPGPTFCPDCGRLVSPIAPRPNPGDKPPPTREELLHDNPAALQTGN